MVEQWIENPRVGSSILPLGTIPDHGITCIIAPLAAVAAPTPVEVADPDINPRTLAIFAPTNIPVGSNVNHALIIGSMMKVTAVNIALKLMILPASAI